MLLLLESITSMLQSRNALREMGWSKLEADCYCALVEYGEMTASDIAAHINARQEKVYQPLKRLESKGYVLIKEENPQRYRAQNPRFVIGEERDSFRSDTDNILKELQEAWETAEEGMTRAGEYAWVLSGKEGMNSYGLQLADWVCSTVKDRLVDDYTDEFYQYIDCNLHRNDDGDLIGCGLKIYPLEAISELHGVK